MTQEFFSNGKLLITGEYVVLDGALSLAVPTKFGQSLQVKPAKDGVLSWTALDKDRKVWFKTRLNFDGRNFIPDSSNPSEKEKRLQQLFSEAYRINPQLFVDNKGFYFTTIIDFPQKWGLGSSSTLINNFARWVGIDPYLLLEKTFGGSGYDIAAAQTNYPFTYQLTKEGRRALVSNFDPAFKEDLFFVHLNQKQNSRDSISHYRLQPTDLLEDTILKISAVTQRIIHCTSLAEFQLFIDVHETLISKLINTPKIKSEMFPDFPGAIKSLGGWGGDFLLATGREEEKEYFRRKGYSTILSYSEMVK